MNNSVAYLLGTNKVNIQQATNSVLVQKVRVKETNTFITPIQIITLEEVE
jgi:hypothetical protein